MVDELGIDVVEIGKAALFHTFNPREIALQMGVRIELLLSYVGSYDALQSRNCLGSSCASQLQELVCLFEKTREFESILVYSFASLSISSLLRGFRSESGSIQ